MKVFVCLAIFYSLVVNAAEISIPWKDQRDKFAKGNAPALQIFDQENFPAGNALPNPNGKKRSGPRTDAFIIIKDGALIYERYDRGHMPETKHVAWSVSKSVMSLLYGVAYKEKKFELTDSICKFEEFSNSDFCKITFEQALHWETGLQWLEEYEKSKAPKKASILAMLYGEGHRDMFSFVARQPLEFSPGTSWKYSSGDSMILSYLLAKMYPGEDLHKVFNEKIFAPIGAKDWMFERDAAGTIAGAYYLHISARDLARIGTLVLNDGQWNGRSILAKNWMSWARKVAPAFRLQKPAHDGRHIGGGHWWLNDKVAAGLDEAPLSALPKDAFFAMGHWGQYLIAVPSLKLVVVRMGDTRDGSARVDIVAKSVAKLLGHEVAP